MQDSHLKKKLMAHSSALVFESKVELDFEYKDFDEEDRLALLDAE